MSQLSDAQNSGFNPYEHARRKREQAAAEHGVTAAGELAFIEEWGARTTAVIAQTDDRQFPPHLYEPLAMAVLTLLAPEFARRAAALDGLRGHLLAEADRLDPQDKPGWNLPSRNVARTLRQIVVRDVMRQARDMFPDIYPLLSKVEDENPGGDS